MKAWLECNPNILAKESVERLDNLPTCIDHDLK
jgi:hypothetical protein